MQPIRIIYEDTPDSIPIPEQLRHRKTEIILWPLEDAASSTEPTSDADSRQRKPGSARGKLTIMADDQEHLDDFEDYMP
jgi:hypothetical protein